MHPLDKRLDILLAREHVISPFDKLDHGVEHAADRGDKVTNVIGEIPVIDGEHANIVTDDDKAREVHRADIVQSGVDRILVLCDRQRGQRSSDR